MPRFTLALLLLCLLTLLPGSAMAQNADTSSPRTVTVSGEGEASAEPDQAVVRFAVVTRAEEAETAREQNAEAAAEAMSAARSFDVPEDRIQLESLTLRPRREYNRQTGQTEELGYEAARRVRVELHDLEQLPGLIATVVERGANRLDGVEYGLQDASEVRNQALRRAAENARDKARLLATTLGASLGPVHQIREESYSPQPPRPMMMEASAAKTSNGGEPEAYAAGRITIETTIQVTFLIE